jgi:CheY-like chemotaxis protein
MRPEQLQIVLIEDNPADVILTRMTLDAAKVGEANCSYGLTVLTDGARAAAYFDDDSNPRPDLVILDLNLPKMHGFEVLERMRKQPNYKALDVIVLSSSHSTAEHERARLLGVREYFHKPNSLPGYQKLAIRGRAIGKELIARKR